MVLCFRDKLTVSLPHSLSIPDYQGKERNVIQYIVLNFVFILLKICYMMFICYVYDNLLTSKKVNPMCQTNCMKNVINAMNSKNEHNIISTFMQKLNNPNRRVYDFSVLVFDVT